MSQTPRDPGLELIEALQRLREMNWELTGRVSDGIERVNRVGQALLSGNLRELKDGVKPLLRKNKELVIELHAARETLDRIMDPIPSIPLRTQLFKDLMRMNVELMQMNEVLVRRIHVETIRILDELKLKRELPKPQKEI